MTKPTGIYPSESKKQPPQQGLIQEVAIGPILSDKLMTENQIKKG